MKQDFPLFTHNPDLVYLDYANTAPKPQTVIQAVCDYYTHYSGNVHRANHDIGSRADHAYETARHRIATYFGVQQNEVVFQKNTTEAINLVAQSFVGKLIEPGDKILLTGLEHHANLVSWQLLAARTGAELVFSQVDEDGCFDEQHWLKLLISGVRFAAFTAVSNVTGERFPIEQMLAAARGLGVPTLIDGAQLTPHERVDFDKLGADFLVFSGHKIYGPTGIGVLIGRYELLDQMTPWIGGGDMIDTVHLSGSTFQEPPLRFEAGTPPIASVIGLGAAIDYLEQHLTPEQHELESTMMQGVLDALNSIEGIHFLGDPDRDARLASFVIEGVHSADLGAYLNEKNVAVRVGKMCAHPLLERCGVDSAVRASIGLCTDQSDIDQFATAITKAVQRLR